MNWNIVFLVVVVGIAGLIWYDAKQDAILEQQEAAEGHKQREQELKAELEHQRELLAEEQQKRQLEIKKERESLEDELAVDRMDNQTMRDHLQEQRKALAEEIDTEIQLEETNQEFKRRAQLREEWEECLREVDDPDLCPDYNELYD